MFIYAIVDAYYFGMLMGVIGLYKIYGKVCLDYMPNSSVSSSLYLTRVLCLYAHMMAAKKPISQFL